METSLQGANLTVDAFDTSLQGEHGVDEEEHHVHLPNPSLWPIILSVAILFPVIRFMVIPYKSVVTIISAPFILVGIMGWALEDPMASAESAKPVTYGPVTSAQAQAVLDQAQAVIEQTVTFGSTAYSTHPIKAEIESQDNGVVLALYGKVELEAQRSELEEAVRSVPNVRDVHNYVVAEDAILNLANVRLEKLRTQGKLDGATDISILVENYILSLYGQVPTTDMKYLLEREMIGIPGVRVVINHIGLNKDIPGNLGRTTNKIGGV